MKKKRSNYFGRFVPLTSIFLRGFGFFCFLSLSTELQLYFATRINDNNNNIKNQPHGCNGFVLHMWKMMGCREGEKENTHTHRHQWMWERKRENRDSGNARARFIENEYTFLQNATISLLFSTLIIPFIHFTLDNMYRIHLFDFHNN